MMIRFNSIWTGTRLLAFGAARRIGKTGTTGTILSRRARWGL
jgi:hypothetical protein